VPNLFHVQVNDAFYESIDGELVMTKWRGMPLVRYNLQDRVQFYSWKAACLLCSEAEPRSKSFWIAMSNLPMTDMISVAGRTGGCVFLCESIIYETMLQDVFLQSSISSKSTGLFVVWTENNKGQQFLCWQIELKSDIAIPNEEEVEVIYREFVKLMCQQQNVFKNDYENLYKRFERDGLRVFKFFFSTFPHLSEHPYLTTGFKRKLIVEKGPI
jgi:phenylacetate-coenzyme A ligase PaaK-like adenylate-forming protein